MAKLNVEVRPNGDMNYVLEFAGRTFDMTMVRVSWGAQGNKPALDIQVERELGDVLNSILDEFDVEEVLETIDDLQSFSASDWGDNIAKLTKFEAQLKAEAMP